MKLKINKQAVGSILTTWLPLAFITTALCGLVYVVAQQNYRENANDPQIQLAEDISALLAGGADPQNLVSSQPTDISKTLAPFLMVFDDSGKSVVSSATLDGKAPDFPKGVLDYARNHSDNRVTWQPAVGQRFATVIRYYTSDSSKGFVVIGRSLKEVEARVTTLTKMVTAAWGAIVIGLLLLLTIMRILPNVHFKLPRFRRH